MKSIYMYTVYCTRIYCILNFLNFFFYLERREGAVGKLPSLTPPLHPPSQLSFKQEQQHIQQQHLHQPQHQQYSNSIRQQQQQQSQTVQSASVSTQANRSFHSSQQQHSPADMSVVGAPRIPDLPGVVAPRLPDLRSSPRHHGGSPNFDARNSPRIDSGGVPNSGGGSPAVEIRRTARASVASGGGDGGGLSAAPPPAAAARRKSEGTSKDYNRHWLIQVGLLEVLHS